MTGETRRVLRLAVGALVLAALFVGMFLLIASITEVDCDSGQWTVYDAWGYAVGCVRPIP